jgi:hypothetical protein
MSRIETRKKLLIAESELNRAQLVEEWQTIADEVHSLANRARKITTFASAAASLFRSFTLFRRKITAPSAEKTPWLQTALKRVGQISAIWSAFRTRTHEQKKEES